MTRNQLTSVAIVVAIAGALAGVALGTPGSGIVSASILARASFVEQSDLKFKVNGGRRDVIHVPNAQETVMQQIVLGPGGQTGWHSHPGPAVALVIAGELTLYASDDRTCTGRTYTAGQAFIDSGQGHVHLARNLSQDQNAEVWVTYFDVPPGGAVRIDAGNPGNCPF